MTNTEKYRPHRVNREDRPDGSILLTSGYDMSPMANAPSDWLHQWAAETPDAVFLAERSGPGWREMRYAQALHKVRAIAGALLARGMGADTPILIISGNSVDHGLISLAAQYVGIPTVPVAEQYSLIPGAEAQLKYIIGLTRPKMVFAEDGDVYGRALALDEVKNLDIVVGRNAPAGATPLADLLAASDDGVDAAAEQVGPDTVAKVLMTSGSTSNPKGVLTTNRMMCANQAQIRDAMPFVAQRPPRLVDWLPWNHVFGGSHNFNLVLANGGSLYIDGGKPAPALVGKTIENNRLMSSTISFNVPVGFAALRDAMREDAGLRRTYFSDLDMIFYAGASLPDEVFQDLRSMAKDELGHEPLITSSWGLTETAPAALSQHEPIDRAGIIGVPMTGSTVKLVPDDDNGRFDVRVKGPHIFEGYFEDPEQTAEAFDEEGFFKTGDAMKFVDPGDMNKGMKFDGRLSEDFKLVTGTWVRAANLRLEVLGKLAPLAMDVVITGADRWEVGVMIVPSPALTGEGGHDNHDGALMSDAIHAALHPLLDAMAAEVTASSKRIARAMVLAEPPSMEHGEVTAKGNLNFNKLLNRRAALLERLHGKASDPAVIRIHK